MKTARIEVLKKFIQRVRHSLVFWLLAAIISAVGLKAGLLAAGVIPFNSDEAIVALMARHILQGEHPIFFYGQAYMGSLDAWLIAAGFRVFGEHIFVVRLVQGLLYIGTLLTTAKLGELALGSLRTGVLAAWLLAIPNVIVTLYTTVTLGGYGEALLIGNGLLIAALLIDRDLHLHGHTRGWYWFLWGLLAGGGLWVFGLTLVYSLPSGLYLLYILWKRRYATSEKRTAPKEIIPIGLIILGGLTGALPWLIYALQHGVAVLITELTVGGIGGVAEGSWLLRSGRHLLSLLLFGGSAVFGLRPSWEIRWLAMPLLPFALIFWIGVLIYAVRRLKRGQPHRRGVMLLWGVMLTLSMAFVFTTFGSDPSGRYFIPLSVPLALFAAEMLLRLEVKRRFLGYGLGLFVLIFNLWGTLECALRVPPGITTQFDPVAQVDHRFMDELIEFLQGQGEVYGYTNYWVAYPLAFRSNEELIFIPRLPYHEDFRYTTRDDRYPPYQQNVAQAERVAYITTKHPELDLYLQEKLTDLGVTWQEKQIGDYHIFYDLSEVIRPNIFEFESE